jgi:hypothetical protein
MTTEPVFGTSSSPSSMEAPIDDVTGVETGIAGAIVVSNCAPVSSRCPSHRKRESKVPPIGDVKASPGSDHNDKLGA